MGNWDEGEVLYGFTAVVVQQDLGLGNGEKPMVNAIQILS